MNLIQHIRKSGLVISTLLVLCGSMLFLNACDDDNGGDPEKPTPTVTALSPTSGGPGTTVTLTGTNFSTAPADVVVKFGTQTATVASSTATQVTATVPSGLTPGTVAVTVTIGTKTSTGINFTVTAPAPTITAIQPLSGSKGTTVTITGTNFSTTASTIKFGTATATVTSATATQLVTKVPDGVEPGAYAITVTVGTETATGTQNFTVKPVKAISLYWIATNEGQAEIVKGTPGNTGEFSADVLYPATTDASVTGMARDGLSNALYWVEQTLNFETFDVESTIWKGDTLAGEPTAVLGGADGLMEVTTITIDAAHSKMYWADRGVLYYANTDGTDKTELFGGTQYGNIVALAVNATALYFIAQDEGGSVIYKSQPDGSGTPTALLDDSDVPAAAGTENNFVSLVASNETLYIASQPAQAQDKSEILKADLTAAAPTLEIVYQSTDNENPLNYVLGVTRDPKTGYLYWINRGQFANGSDGSIYRGAAEGTGTEEITTGLKLSDRTPVNGRSKKKPSNPHFVLAF